MGGNPPDGGAPYGEVTENGSSAPLDFSTTSPSSTSEDQQPVNLSDRLLPAGSSPPNSYAADGGRKYPIKTEYGNKVRRGTSLHLSLPVCIIYNKAVCFLVPSLQLREL